MTDLVLRSDEIGLLPIKNLKNYIDTDLLSIINMDLINNTELNNIIKEHELSKYFLLYIFINECSNNEVKDYLFKRFSSEKLLSDVLNIKKIYYSNNLVKIIRKYNVLANTLLDSIMQIQYDVDIKKELVEIDDNYSEYELFENEYLRIINLDNNINEINEFINSPSRYSKEFGDYDKLLENIILDGLKEKLKINEYDLFLMFNEIVSSFDWINVSEDIKNKVIEQIYLFSSKLNVFCDIKQFTLFSDSKCKVLKDKYEKNYNK